MDFEEWWNTKRNKADTHWKLLAHSAWEAAFEEGYKFANKENEEYDKIGV